VHPFDVPTITIDELPPAAVLLDCREDEEWAAGHIDGAVHVPMNQLPQRLQYEPGPLTPDVPIVVVCKMGGRSAYVAAWLNDQGYNAVNLDGGMLSWATAHRPMISSDGSAPYVA
jgi:rhodanese-related sulfurtransferase